MGSNLQDKQIEVWGLKPEGRNHGEEPLVAPNQTQSQDIVPKRERNEEILE